MRLALIAFVVGCGDTPSADRDSAPASVVESESPGVGRTGRSLQITLARGDSVVLTDSLPDDPNGVWFRYREMLPAVGYHLIETRFYEGGGYLLVNHKTGWSALSNGVPIVSPDRLRLAAANVDLDAEYSPTTLQIWRLAADSLILELEHDFVSAPIQPDSVWGPGRLEWLSPTELRAAREFATGSVSGSARAVREGARWRIVVP